MEKPVIIFGAGSVGKNAKQIFESNGVLVYGFLDDDDSLIDTEIDGITVFGATDAESMLSVIGSECEAFVAVDENEIRKTIINDLIEKNKVMPINAIHSSVIMTESSNVGHGNFINAQVVLGPNSVIGHHCILHLKAAIDEGVTIGDFVQIGMGCNINAGVIIEDEVFIGAGVTIVAGIKIGKRARIGAGSVVVAHVKENAVLFGNPASEVK